MNARKRDQRLSLPIIAVLACGLCLIGCDRSDDGKKQAAGEPNKPATGAAAKSTPTETSGPLQRAAESDTTPSSQPADPPPPADRAAGTFQIEAPGGSAAGTPEHELPAGLPTEKLIAFLSVADKDMRAIGTGQAGIKDARKARAEMKRITSLKLDASRQLQQREDADAEAKIEGARGELQALSTLASLGDVKSAQALALLAKRNLASNDARLVADSRLVLIGFAIEAVQNGKERGANEIIELINDLASSETAPDLPAMMVMGQARQVLDQFGHEKQSKQVRDLIIDLFANSPDPDIAQMAAQFAGTVRFDAIEKLRATAVAGQPLSTDRWREAIATLIEQSPDLLTVKFLAGAALELEATGNDELAVATYDEMSQRFNTPGEATTREVQLAIEARNAHDEVIGKEFDPDLPSVAGGQISMADYRGKVVLMPFWAAGFPESLQVVPLLTKLRDAQPEKIAIVGMNLDPAGAATDAYAEKQLGFPSYRSESSATASLGNPVAARFGVVSMPFVAIINQKGQIEAIDFGGQKLEATVNRFLAPLACRGLKPLSFPTCFVAEVGRLPKNRRTAERNRNLA